MGKARQVNRIINFSFNITAHLFHLIVFLKYLIFQVCHLFGEVFDNFRSHIGLSFVNLIQHDIYALKPLL